MNKKSADRHQICSMQHVKDLSDKDPINTR